MIEKASEQTNGLMMMSRYQRMCKQQRRL